MLGLKQCRVVIYGSVPAAEGVWRELELHAYATAFQSYRWQEAWARIAGPARNERPVIAVVLEADGRPLMLMPFALGTFQGVKVLGWQGQDHATYGMGLYAPGVAERIDKDTLGALIEVIRKHVPEASALRLKNQPARWQGLANPFAQLGVQEGASRSYQLDLESDFDAQIARSLKKDTRGKLRRATASLAAVPGFALISVDTVDGRLALLGRFLEQKSRQFAERGIPNPFNRPEIVAFYRDLAGETADRAPLLDCHALSAGGAVLATATSIGFQDQRHLLTLSLGTIEPELLKHSPGLVLMRQLIAAAAQSGTRSYDFGAGDGQHKTVWRPQVVTLFETHLPLSLRGYAASYAAASGLAIKRMIKNNQMLWQAAQSARKLLRSNRE